MMFVNPNVAVLALICAPPAMADNLTCDATGGCNNRLECVQVDETFGYRENPDGTVAFGWTEGPTFTATPMRHGGMTTVTATEGPDTIHTLVLGSDLTGIVSVSAMIEGKLFAAMETLTCRKAAE
jgi:hypothetical protein